MANWNPHSLLQEEVNLLLKSEFSETYLLEKLENQNQTLAVAREAEAGIRAPSAVQA